MVRLTPSSPKCCRQQSRCTEARLFSLACSTAYERSCLFFFRPHLRQNKLLLDIPAHNRNTVGQRCITAQSLQPERKQRKKRSNKERCTSEKQAGISVLPPCSGPWKEGCCSWEGAFWVGSNCGSCSQFQSCKGKRGLGRQTGVTCI